MLLIIFDTSRVGCVMVDALGVEQVQTERTQLGDVSFRVRNSATTDADWRRNTIGSGGVQAAGWCLRDMKLSPGIVMDTSEGQLRGFAGFAFGSRDFTRKIELNSDRETENETVDKNSCGWRAGTDGGVRHGTGISALPSQIGNTTPITAPTSSRATGLKSCAPCFRFTANPSP